MLPPGHIAGGYLVVYSLVKIFQPQFSPTEINQLLWYGMFFAFVPDLDMFVSFFRQRSCIIQKEHNHRKFYSHTPIVWLIVGCMVMIFAQSLFVVYIGLLIWLASWSHFVFDSLNYGIMWLFPFSRRLFSIRDAGVELEIKERGFFSFWMAFMRNYATRFRLTFFSEIGVVCMALIVFLFL
ncbi:metal-dependent hydrolase [Candidatus Uhrbacteria bacterium]|nr:metal-dependent hydrolase [Candidatus Uhrbacteria bacterium]